MRFLVLLLFCAFGVLISLSLIMSGHLDVEVGKNHLRKVVGNTSEHALPYYPEGANKTMVVGELATDQFLDYAYSGKTGAWQYAQKSDATVSFRNGKADVGFLVLERMFIPVKYSSQLFWIGFAGIVLSFMLLVLMQYRRRRQSKSSVIQQQQFDELHQHNQRLLHDNQNLQARLEEERNRQESLEQQLITLDIASNQRFEELSMLLREQVEKESYERYQVTIDEMAQSYERLYQRYEQVVSEAKEMGIDFFDKNYESILKGRRYEICVATDLVRDNLFEILEWTPDKGFESNIPVASNTNPDLVVESANGEVIAIECKFRSGYFFKSTSNEISWSNVNQVRRYQDFESSRRIPVYIALGFGGVPQNPDNHYIVFMNDIIAISREEVVGNACAQTICREDSLQSFAIANGCYAEYLCQTI